MKKRVLSVFRYFFALVLLFPLHVYAEDSLPEKYHQVTLYIMPTMHPLDWSSPSTLYKTMKDCYLKTLGLPDNYLLGHVAVKLESPVLQKPLLIAQTSGTVQEKTDLILKQKVGFGIMGAALTGRIESEKELEHKLDVYAKRKKLAFVRYLVSEKAMYRILGFIEKYKQKINEKNAACDFYGGAFWPRYYNEGAGCSSFGVALLDVANLLSSETNKWRLDLNIPKKIIGGKYNNGKKVKNTTIKNTNSWFQGSGKPNQDFVKYFVYEPSIMFDWIINNRRNPETACQPVEENDVPGLIFDKTQVEFDENEPFFVARPEPNLFIDEYYKKIGIN